jgi:NADH-quinone oxidoreductase subunit L
LFLGSGSVIHGLSGEQDIRKMGGLRRHMPITAFTFLIGALANAGIFFLAGFWSKDEILYGAFAGGHIGVWTLGAAGAFLTALYMMRCYYLTFEGRSRIDEKAAHHLHESPLVMTVPLLVLAFFSAFVGFIGFPPEHGIYHRFVEPVFAVAKVAETHEAPVGVFQMAILSLAIAVAGILVALRFYHWRPDTPARMVERFPQVYRVLLNKYYVDELYDALFVEPIRRGSFWLWRQFDERVIDGSVNGVGAMVRRWSTVLRRVQTGYVMNYVLSFIVGVVVILGYLAFWR